jgi:uncharacterized phage protein gp47/JayE
MAVEIPSFDELYETGKSAALLRTQKLNAKSFAPGYMSDVHLGLAAALGEEVARIAVALHLRTFFGTATGEDLDKLASDHFGLARQAGAASVGSVRFSRPTAAFGPVLIPAGTLLETADGTRFVLISEPLLTGTQIDAQARAEVVGEAGNIEASSIITIVSALADPSIIVTNLAEFSGGIGAESDAAFRARIVDYVRTLRRGTVLALEVGALSVAGVVAASVDESAYPPTVYIADVTGSANPELAEAVAAELENWRAAGVQVNVVGATVVFQNLTLSLSFYAGFDSTRSRDAVREAVVTLVNGLSIGGKLFRSQVVAAALGVDGIQNAVVTNPAGDVVPTANQVIRTEPDRVAI